MQEPFYAMWWDIVSSYFDACLLEVIADGLDAGLGEESAWYQRGG